LREAKRLLEELKATTTLPKGPNI